MGRGDTVLFPAQVGVPGAGQTLVVLKEPPDHALGWVGGNTGGPTAGNEAEERKRARAHTKPQNITTETQKSLDVIIKKIKPQTNRDSGRERQLSVASNEM